MRKDLLIIALALSFAGPARADVLAVPEENQAAMTGAAVTLPAKGSAMTAVQKKYGAPRQKHAPRGGDTPKHPPITRWDYDGFSVFFEHDKVVDSVIPGRPPRVYNKDRLTPVAASQAPRPPMPAPTTELAPPPAEMAPPAEAEPIVPPPDDASAAPEMPAEAAAAPSPDESAEPAADEPPPAETPAASEYPDSPPGYTPAEEYPDAPPTPK